MKRSPRLHSPARVPGTAHFPGVINRSVAPLSLLLLAISPFIACAVLSCAAPPPPRAEAPFPPYPAARFAVISDLHLLAEGLGSGTAAYAATHADDPKLHEHSAELLDAAVAMICAEKPGFVLVPGDLSKDGERDSLLEVASKLAALRSAGIAVYVVPGNHDVDNPAATAYSDFTDPRSFPATPVSAGEFSDIFADCGYSGAIARDPSSLSYAAEPTPGLALLAIDSVRRPRAAGKTSGALSEATRAWVLEQAAAARAAGKACIVMLHHGLLEHFAGQASALAEYLVEDHDALARELADRGARLAFSGHFHAQDATIRRYGPAPDGEFILDVETGSLVSYPCPVRFLAVDDRGVLRGNTRLIESIPAAPSGFQAIALSRAIAGAKDAALAKLAGFGISGGRSEELALVAARAFAAHFKGDEAYDPSMLPPSASFPFPLSAALASQREVLWGLFHDREPADNDFALALPAGGISAE